MLSFLLGSGLDFVSIFNFELSWLGSILILAKRIHAVETLLNSYLHLVVCSFSDAVSGAITHFQLDQISKD
jgi:hypothetical protein